MELRPVLPPGGDVVRRDAHTLAIGGRPGVLVPDRPGLVRLLRLVDGRGTGALARLVAERVPDLDGEVDDLVQELVACGALLPGPPPPPARLSFRVRHWRGSAPVARLVSSALDELQLRPGPGDDALLVLVSAGEPPRAWVEQAVESGVPVLPVVVGDTWSRIGPLTVAGRTPCLGCHDVARAAWDPAWRVVLPQLGRPLVPAPPPTPPTSLLHRTAAAVVEQVLQCTGDTRPETVGAVLHLVDRTLEREPVPVNDACTSLLHRVV